MTEIILLYSDGEEEGGAALGSWREGSLEETRTGPAALSPGAACREGPGNGITCLSHSYLLLTGTEIRIVLFQPTEYEKILLTSLTNIIRNMIIYRTVFI